MKNALHFIKGFFFFKSILNPHWSTCFISACAYGGAYKYTVSGTSHMAPGGKKGVKFVLSTP